MCNGIDESLLGVNLAPFGYGIVSPYDVKPIGEKRLSYNYSRVNGSGGKITNLPKEITTVDNLYEFIQRMFPPLSTIRGFYNGEFEEIRSGIFNKNKKFDTFRYFGTDDIHYYEEGMCLLDAIRLFKTNRAGFGLGIALNGGINEEYSGATNYLLWKFLPIFTLDNDEKQKFQDFYKEFREWYFKDNPDSKDQLTKKMLDLFRNAYRYSDVETAFIALSGIWELFAQQFPEEDSPIGEGVSVRIRQSVSRMVRNRGIVKGKNQDNLYDRMGYLYHQRSIIIHKDEDE